MTTLNTNVQSTEVLHAFSQPARKNTANRNLLRQNFIAYIFRSQRAREQEQEQEKEQEQESKKEKKNGKTPSLLRRIILRLGRITP
jgi:hydroxylamine reductase (hybrid-cluster protein)